MIPDYQTLMLPVLNLVNEGVCKTQDIIAYLANSYELTNTEREELLPSRKQRRFDNRVHWAVSYLRQAGLIKNSERGMSTITEAGQKVIVGKPERIDNRFLYKYQSFRDFKAKKNNQNEDGVSQSTEEIHSLDTDDATPDEIIRQAYKQINDALAVELLERVRKATPQFFENLLIELLLAMGYGGSTEDAARAIGQSGDGGVDGVIDQDTLGIDQLYIQAKRYAENNSVGSGAIRDFFGALNIKKAQKGLFVTTSNFSQAAKQTVKDLGMRIVLIDGEQLAKLLIRYNIGCRDEDVLYLKKIDEDFFGE